MKTKSKITRLLAATLTLALVFLFCVAMPLTVSAEPSSPEETTQTSTPATDPPAQEQPPAENPPPAEEQPPADGFRPAEGEKKPPNGATPPYFSTGNIIEVVRENSVEETGLQFVIFKTASDKIFYLVIDYDKGSDNVYLLTEVGENDLLNFIEVDANGNPAGNGTPPGNNGNGQQNPAQPETPSKNDTTGLIVLVIAVVGIGGAAFYFFKNKGKNKPLKAADFDFDDEDDYYDEPTVNEDDED